MRMNSDFDDNRQCDWIYIMSICVARAKQGRHLDRNDDGILDYDTPGALCDLLRDTYGALPACRYVLASHLMKIWC